MATTIAARRGVRASVRAHIALTKPRIIELLLVTAVPTMFLAAQGLPTVRATIAVLVGGALAAIVLGSPYAAVFILTLVLIIQGIIFGDGGLTTMGANIINMGVIGGFIGYYGYTSLKSAGANIYLSAAIAAWLACFIASLAAAVEMAIAGTFPLVPGLIAMGTYHAAIGVIEGVITAAIIYFLVASRPDLLADEVQGAPAGGVAA